MKKTGVLFISMIMLFTLTATATAGEFGWTKDFNIQAQADPSGFRARLAARFNLGDVQVKAILSNFDSPADAYIVFRLGEISGIPTSSAIEKYRSQKGKGWGALAKSLGIKPGSKEFHSLKRSQDLYDGNSVEVHFGRYEQDALTLLTLEKAKKVKKSKGKK